MSASEDRETFLPTTYEVAKVRERVNLDDFKCNDLIRVLTLKGQQEKSRVPNGAEP